MFPFKRTNKPERKEETQSMRFLREDMEQEGRIEKLKSWRGIGRTFLYLGRTCVVKQLHKTETRYVTISYLFPPMPVPKKTAAIIADYATENGEIKQIVFDFTELDTLIEMNEPNC